MCYRVLMSALALVAAVSSTELSAESPAPAAVDVTALTSKTWTAADSLSIRRDASESARNCLEGLKWAPGRFEVKCTPAKPNRGDLLVRFASPVPAGDELNDLVAMEWYFARDARSRIMKAPAVIVVHESGSRMTVGRLFARGLQQRGLHTFLLHLPHYGERRRGRKRPEKVQLITTIRQAVADVRRARDAVAVLPHVDSSRIALQGTSLGGIVSATSASLDAGYDRVFLLLAGGHLYDMLQNGKRDAAKVREAFEKAGVTNEQLRALAEAIEPTRIAHRLDARMTWLYSGKYDTVVPPANAAALAEAAKLAPLHHIQMPANHYSGLLYLPFVLDHIAGKIRAPDAGPQSGE